MLKNSVKKLRLNLSVSHWHPVASQYQYALHIFNISLVTFYKDNLDLHTLFKQIAHRKTLIHLVSYYCTIMENILYSV